MDFGQLWAKREDKRNAFGSFYDLVSLSVSFCWSWWCY